jgi:hypothetical protein
MRSGSAAEVSLLATMPEPGPFGQCDAVRSVVLLFGAVSESMRKSLATRFSNARCNGVLPG